MRPNSCPYLLTIMILDQVTMRRIRGRVTRPTVNGKDKPGIAIDAVWQSINDLQGAGVLCNVFHLTPPIL